MSVFEPLVLIGVPRLCGPQMGHGPRARNVVPRRIESRRFVSFRGTVHGGRVSHLKRPCCRQTYWAIAMDGLWANGVKAPAKLTAVRLSVAPLIMLHVPEPSSAYAFLASIFAGYRHRHVVNIRSPRARVRILWPHPRLQTCQPVRARLVVPHVPAKDNQSLISVFFFFFE